ncbi:MAG: MotA/TolQ/ExbB proton channel family protein [Thermoguttaceae bacterium]|jgi:biopolymer transport protein ExbB
MRTERRVGQKWVWLTLLVILSTVLMLNSVARVSQAQEAGAAAAGEGTEAPHQTESYFVWFLKCSGFIGFVILCLSIYFIATVGRMFVELRMVTAMPPEVLGQCEALLEQRDFKGIFNAVKEDDSFFSRVLVTGITELPNGLSEAREAMERVGEMLTAEMEKKISMLAVLGTLGPMIGLLGTLKGMIASFSVIAVSDVQLKASAVAKGISEALLLTFEGVSLSVPSIYFFAFFRNRVSIISVTAMTRADEFLRHFAQAARAKPAAGATPTRAKV